MEKVKVKCKFCGLLKEGFRIKHYNLKICFDCFPDFFKNRIQHTIEKFKMFEKDSSLLVAISGGKDSMSMAKALKELGYNLRAIHLNVNLGDISDKSQKIVEKFCQNENIPLLIIDLNLELNVSLKDLSRISRRPICAVCGMLRRYFINREAKDEVIVTGHTLNDEVSFIFKNMLFWNDDLLSRISPLLYEKEGLHRKVKPLCFITEEETLQFCNVMKIEHIEDACPYKSEVYDVFKDTVNHFNQKFPGSILGFYKGFLKRVENFYSVSSNSTYLQACQSCGYPTNMSLCSICRLKEKLLQYKNHG